MSDTRDLQVGIRKIADQDQARFSFIESPDAVILEMLLEKRQVLSRDIQILDLIIEIASRSKNFNRLSFYIETYGPDWLAKESLTPVSGGDEADFDRVVRLLVSVKFDTQKKLDRLPKDLPN